MQQVSLYIRVTTGISSERVPILQLSQRLHLGHDLTHGALCRCGRACKGVPARVKDARDNVINGNPNLPMFRLFQSVLWLHTIEC